MGLDTSRVYKCLEKKTLILGFEIVDLFALSLLLCVLNFIFSGAEFKLFYTFGPVLVVALILRLAKRGQADNFILHWLKYHFTPGILQAFPVATDQNLLNSLRKKGHANARFNARQ
jgi:hypothetical protein